MDTMEKIYLANEVHYDSTKLSVLNAHLEKMFQEDKIHGAAYCLSRYGKVIANYAMGRFSYKEEDTRLLTTDDYHDIASITKLFTACAIMKLFENGKLLLSDPAGKFIDELNTPPFTQITIANLLTHTSGLYPDKGCIPNLYSKGYYDYIEEGFTCQEENWIKSAMKLGLRMEAGKEWAYCSFGYTLLGEIIKRVTGLPAEQYIKENILIPCGLNDTYFSDDFFANSSHIRKLSLLNEEMEQEVQTALINLSQNKNSHDNLWSQIPNTAGGLYSKASDLVKLGNMLAEGGRCKDKQVLSRLSVYKMTTNQLSPTTMDYCWNTGGVVRSYGFGPDLRRNNENLYSEHVFFHEGAGGSCLMIDPNEQFVAAWFVPFTHGNWHAEGLRHMSNIIWSGLL